MKRFLSLFLVAALSTCAMTPAIAAEPHECIAKGESIGAPVDFGRVPQPTLSGLAAQSLLAALGAEPEAVEATDEVVIYWHSPRNEAEAAADIRWVAAYGGGCLVAYGPFRGETIAHLLPGA